MDSIMFSSMEMEVEEGDTSRFTLRGGAFILECRGQDTSLFMRGDTITITMGRGNTRRISLAGNSLFFMRDTITTTIRAPSIVMEKKSDGTQKIESNYGEVISEGKEGILSFKYRFLRGDEKRVTTGDKISGKIVLKEGK